MRKSMKLEQQHLIAQTKLIETGLQREPGSFHEGSGVGRHHALVRRVLVVCALAFLRKHAAAILHFEQVLQRRQLGIGRWLP